MKKLCCIILCLCCLTATSAHAITAQCVGSPTPTPKPSCSPTKSPTPTPTRTPTPSPTKSPTCSPTPTRTPTPSPTATPTRTPTPSPTVSPTPSCTPSPTPTPRKVTICHLTGAESGAKAITIEVDESALQAHIDHGDRVGACTFDCAGVPFGQAVVDQCGVCGGDNSSCKDCSGAIHGEKVIDQCGVCGGDGTSCLGCDHVANSHKTTDECGVCGGDNSSCKDCAGTINGTAKIDSCGVCGGQSNTCLDCAGVPNGSSKVDSCGTCRASGDPLTNVCFLDCAGIPNGTSTVDQCGVCNGLNSCLDCAGVPNGGTLIDACGICGGPGGEKISFKDTKKELKKLAETIFFKKTVPYYKGVVKCNKDLKKSVAKRTTLAEINYQLFLSTLTKLKLEVEVCPGQCALLENEKVIKELVRINKKLYTFASDAQHSARNACHATGPGVAGTKPISSQLNNLITRCPTGKVCK